jgi:uncharacterized protein YbaP (TraB family)
MIKTIGAALSAIALTLSLPACAQSTPAPAAKTQDADPALWVVKDQDTTIYLFGTIHVLKPGLTWFDEAVKKAFDAAQEVKLELVMPDPQAMQSLVMATGMAPAGTPPLTERLPADKRAAFAKAVTDLGLPANALDKYKPWLAATQLSIAPLSKQGYAAASGPEEVITAAAKEAGKPVTGLETAAQQLGYFSSLSDAAQIKFLTSTLDDLPKGNDEMDTMVDDWARGKPELLAKTMNDDLKESPELAKTLLVDRNQRWAGWIKQRLATPGTVFIAVGAGHLAGKDSVQAQLAKLGVKTARVNY